MGISCYLSRVEPRWWDEVCRFIGAEPPPDIERVRALFVRAAKQFPEDCVESIEAADGRMTSGVWAWLFRDLLEVDPEEIYAGFWYGDSRRGQVAALPQIIASVPPLATLGPLVALSLEPTLAIPERCDDPELPMIAWTAATLDLDPGALRPFLERAAFEPFLATPRVTTWQRLSGRFKAVSDRLGAFLDDSMSFAYWTRFLESCVSAAETGQHLLFTQS